MPSKPISAAAALLACVFVGGLGSVSASPTPVPDGRPDFSSMTFLTGTWKCDALLRGKSRADTITYSLGLDNRWLLSHDVAPPFDQYRTRPITSDGWTTYNALNHQWVQITIDDFGSYVMATSPGWKNGSITWTSTVANDGSTGHDTFTKVSDTQTKDIADGADKDGKPGPTITTTCSKQ
jgi:hypothetical protein